MAFSLVRIDTDENGQKQQKAGLWRTIYEKFTNGFTNGTNRLTNGAGAAVALIRPYKDGWQAQVAVKGLRKSGTFATKRLAQEWARRTEQEFAQAAKDPRPQGKTLQQATAHYLETVSPGKRDAVDWERRRFESFCDHIDPLLGRFGDAQLNAIDAPALGRWRDQMLKTVSGSTVVRYVNLYRNLFNLAHREWKWVDAYAWDGVRLPAENAPREAVWRWQQIRQILRAGQQRGGKTQEVVHAFHISLHTSLRLQEALAAPVGYNRATGVITLPNSKTMARPERVPVVTRRGRRLLERLPALNVGANEASTLFSELRTELLIEGLQYKDSRATALTWLARRVDILVLARVSRHKNMELLRSTYYRETPEEIAGRLAG